MQLFERKHHRPSINLTPLIDILFILILFFGVSSRLVQDHGLGLVLPKSQQGDSSTDRITSLSITNQQEFLLNEQPLPLDQLSEALRALQSKQSESSLLFKVDQNVPHGTVIQAMDLAKQAGFQKIVFATEKGTRH